MFYTYVLFSDDYSRFYVGMSKNVTRRVLEHNNGKVASTKSYKPWRVVLVEEHEDRVSARNREKHLKSAVGRRWRKRNINLGM